MKIKVKITKEENAAYYDVPLNSFVDIDFNEYLCGVVASEIGATHIESCRAQAVASRTFAYSYIQKNIAIPDTSSSAQAFRASRINNEEYNIAHQAVADTKGEMLYYNSKLISPCSFSASNGGKTVSSESRWGGHRSYLIEQDDPWDYAATHGEKHGHGVGMSQCGALYAAKTGVSYRDILSFYYPGTYIDKEESPIANVKASDLVKIFNQMADEKWKYVAGAHKYGEVDCSGAFYYAYKKLGSYMYHGSNTMWRKYTKKKGRINEIDLVPGMAVFKCRDWTSSQSSNGWYEKDPGDVYHVGMYVGNGNVVEAKSKKAGVVVTSINTWHYAAELIDTIYDSIEAEENNDFAAFIGTVTINSGYLNMRSGPSTSYSREAKAYNGDMLSIVGEQGDWYIADQEGKSLYVSKNYIKRPEETAPEYIITIIVSAANRQRLEDHLNEAGYVFDIQESWNAA